MADIREPLNQEKETKAGKGELWRWALVLALAAVFAASAILYIRATQTDDFVKWGSPDENANYIFAKLYGQENRLSIFEKYNLLAADIMRPRSMKSDQGWIKPVSFLGLPLIYGWLSRLTSYQLIPYFTALAGAFGLIFYYLLIRLFFGRSNAFVSMFLLAALPPYFYYTVRSLFHNVLFVSLLLAGLYFLAKCLLASRSAPETKPSAPWPIKNRLNIFFSRPRLNVWTDIARPGGAGLFLGLAVSVRTSELIWILPLLLLSGLFAFRRAILLKITIFLAAVGFAVWPVCYWNTVLFGSPYFGGYPEMNQSLIALKDASADLAAAAPTKDWISAGREYLLRTKDIIFHFGFKPRQSVQMVKYYFIAMFPWIFWPGLAGALLLLARPGRIKKRQWAFGLIFLVLSAILTLYYGSWRFFDNPDQTRHTIGNSYTRYWLPVYLGWLPFASLLISRLSGWLAVRRFFPLGDRKFFSRPRRLFVIRAWQAIFVVVIIYLNINFVFSGSEEGLAYAGQKQDKTRQEWQMVIAYTENNAVVITEYHDKILFPERKVINGRFNDLAMNRIYRRLTDFLPVYYFNFTFSPSDLAYLNQRRLKEIGLFLEPVQSIGPDFTLYRLYRQPVSE